MKSACIDENAIGALFDHRLSPTEAEAIDRHVGECTECRDLLASMARLYAPSSPSRATVRTAPLRSATLPLTGERGSADESNIRRLLAFLDCERRVGSLLGGKWRLDGVVGVGGMAEVFAATHVSNGRRAAIKLLRREWMARPNVVYRFLREGYVANRIQHSGAVTILDDGTAEDGTPFLVLELLDGHSANTHVRERLPIRAVLAIATAILDVLAAAHAQGIVHRDIKPENVFLLRAGGAGSVKVLDFGIARMREGQANGTQDGALIGTPAYMPPEQARGGAIDARTDLWAVGATMFALLAGRPVHVGATAGETLASALLPAPCLASVIDIDPAIARIVDRALAFAPSERWADARAMQAALAAVLERADSGELAVSASIAAPPKRLGRRRWMLPISVALACVASFGVLSRVRHAAPSAAVEAYVAATSVPEAPKPPGAPEATPAEAKKSPSAATPASTASARPKRKSRHADPVPSSDVPPSTVVTATPVAPPASPAEASPLDRRD